MAANVIIPFKENKGVPESIMSLLRQKGQEYGLLNITGFETEKIVIAEWVNMKCRYGCKQYNTNWCCPPATPGPREARNIISEYSTALLFEGDQCHPDFYNENSRKRMKQLRGWKSLISLERVLFLEGYHKVFSLIGERCALCKECAYPDNCRFPQEKRPMVESFSIDIVGTLKNIEKTTHVAKQKNEVFRSYGIMLLE